MSYDTDKNFRCICGWGHFLSITGFDDGDPWLTIEGNFRAARLRDKLKACYEIFRRGHYDTWVSVDLDRETVKEVRHELSNFLQEPN